MLQESRPNLLPLGISLQDLLHLPILQNSKVLAGSQGLSNLVTGASLAGAPDIAAPAHPGELFLVDYKTDRHRTPEQLRDLYAPQLALYREALQRRLGLPVARCSLYAFALGREIEVF